MTPRESAVFGVTAKSVTRLAIAFLVLAAFFGFLNIQKIKTVRTNAANAQAARNAAERRQPNAKLNAPIGKNAGTEQQIKIAEAENRAAKAETELAQVQKEKADLQAKLDAGQQGITSLQKRVEEAGNNANASIASSSPGDGYRRYHPQQFGSWRASTTWGHCNLWWHNSVSLEEKSSQPCSARLRSPSPRAQVKRTPSVWLMTRTITAVQPCLGAGRRNGKWRQTPTRSGQRRRAMFADRLWRRPWNKQEPWETGRQFAGDRSSLTSEPGLYRFYLQLIAAFSGRILVRL